MGLLFGNKKKQNTKIILPANAKCCRCGKKIKKGMQFDYMDGRLYCEKCGRAKRDWDMLELFALIDD